jgi:hypothetical protein
MEDLCALSIGRRRDEAIHRRAGLCPIGVFHCRTRLHQLTRTIRPISLTGMLPPKVFPQDTVAAAIWTQLLSGMSAHNRKIILWI